MTYAKPLVRAVEDQTGAAFCYFTFTPCTGDQSVFTPSTGAGGACASATVPSNTTFNPQDVTLEPVKSNTIVGVNDGGAQVSPLAGTGLPFTSSPIGVSAPVATHGIYVDVGLTRAAYAIDRSGFGATVAGNTVVLGLP